jgi:hypothetical protein
MKLNNYEKEILKKLRAAQTEYTEGKTVHAYELLKETANYIVENFNNVDVDIKYN